MTTAVNTNTHTPFVLENTNVYSFKSKITHKQYGICIQYPEGYLQRKEQKPLPVVYILDAQWHFPTIGAIYGTLHHDRQMPEALIVGITWQDGNLFEQRAHDLIPDANPKSPHSGGADVFLDCLKLELIPHIKDTYNTTEKTVLIGSSLGGIFSYYCCLTQPNLFTDYIAFGLDSKSMNKGGKFKQAINQFNSQEINLPTRLIAGRGEWEHAFEVDDFTKELSTISMNNFACEFITVEKAGHALVNPQGFTASLQKIFHQPEVALTSEQLQKFCGSYKHIEKDETLTFYIKNNQLCTKSDPAAGWADFDRKAILTPIGESMFHILGWQKTFEFNEDHVIFTFYGQAIKFQKT